MGNDHDVIGQWENQWASFSASRVPDSAFRVSLHQRHAPKVPVMNSRIEILLLGYMPCQVWDQSVPLDLFSGE
jgi:hypothetical protein